MRTLASIAAALALASTSGCKQPESQLKLKLPANCQDETNLRCVNYIQFTAGGDESSSRCIRTPVALDNLCDLARIAEGQEVFRLPPETALPLRIEGLRVFPAIGCTSVDCPPKKVFSGSTIGSVTEKLKIGDFVGQVLELPVTVDQPCGPPEEFYSLPDGGAGTCAEVCHSPDLVVCDHVEQGCLCLPVPGSPVFQDGGAGPVD